MRTKLTYTREELLALGNAQHTPPAGLPRIRNIYNPTLFRPGAFACAPAKPLDFHHDAGPGDTAPMICIS
ncbi:hypothetical protein [Legionella micdadei]|uniref:Uncharacterized protein n=1 Tax=Legionella micdadei TaxID=451 RepID=A0A098GFK8_LEGMI|nr:hypothetical protein [Legionella micdadei]ARG97271.1 hypothetical protein B6N58_06130 [Legionella micdadei]KTD28148.1 hypothetical protein Lmic_1259 [Legionella micdadei]NSL16778.1 hypothetical protein [Legionella micdadei]CEG61269.1 protein of unknown function [Legionella micdadei]SCY34342.1 hypothetical protein SAMN02982997_01479 [Legionella micdadei]